MVINKRLVCSFATGFLTSVGMGVGHQLCEVVEAFDPLYGVKRKISEAQSKKRFEHIITQIDLKAELG